MDAFVQSGLQHAKLDHLQLMELNSVRPLLPDTLDAINRVEEAAAKARRVRANSTANSQQLNSSSFNRSTY